MWMHLPSAAHAKEACAELLSYCPDLLRLLVQGQSAVDAAADAKAADGRSAIALRPSMSDTQYPDICQLSICKQHCSCAGLRQAALN